MKNEKVKKNNKIFIMFSFIGLVFIVVGIIMYFTNSSNEIELNDKQKENVNIHNMKDGKIDTNNELIKEYFNVFKYTYYKDDELLENIKSNEVNQYMLASRLIKEEETSDAFCYDINSSIVNEEESSCGGVYLKENWEKDTKAETIIIKKEAIDNYYKYYFGKDKETDIKMFNYKSSIFQNMLIYDSELNSYVRIEIGDPSLGEIYIEQLQNVEKKGDDLIFTSRLFPEDVDKGNEEIVTLTLKWEESTYHYIFKDRSVVKK